ncbi:MAG: hypothetical protein NZM39_06485 [Bernardetiaceae bacterium]|nr:hypothetical protein [Bernardetiaceae bacterium]
MKPLVSICAVLFFLAGCKSGVPKTVPSFSMDLSPYRPYFPEPSSTLNNPSEQTNLPPPSTEQVSITNTIQTQLDTLRQAMANTNRNLKFSQGYRIVVYSGNSRQEATKVLSDLQKITTEKPELVYEQPNFRVKLGNFFYRTEAFALYTQIKSLYPNAFITYERITIPLEKYRLKN